MAKKDNLIDLVASQGQGDASSSDADAGPVGSPMSTPQAADGDRMESTSQVALALKLLSLALPPFGSETPEGDAIMSSITKLSKAFKVKLDEARS